jgi:hypothetical protein
MFNNCQLGPTWLSPKSKLDGWRRADHLSRPLFITNALRTTFYKPVKAWYPPGQTNIGRLANGSRMAANGLRMGISQTELH